MLLLAALCGVYCEKFIKCNRGNTCNKLTNSTTDVYLIDYWGPLPVMYCTKFEDMDVLSKPGHWCESLFTREASCTSSGTTYAALYDGRDCVFCTNHKYLPPATPAPTPFPTISATPEPTIPKIKDPKTGKTCNLPLVSFFVLTSLT